MYLHAATRVPCRDCYCATLSCVNGKNLSYDLIYAGAVYLLLSVIVEKRINLVNKRGMKKNDEIVAEKNDLPHTEET